MEDKIKSKRHLRSIALTILTVLFALMGVVSLGGCKPSTDTKYRGLYLRLSDDYSYYTVYGGEESKAVKDGVLEIPAKLNKIPVKSIEGYGFSEWSMRKVVIPDGIAEIHSQSFSGCKNLETVILPETVVLIGAFAGNRAFYDCTALAYNTYDNACYLGSETNPYFCLIKGKSESITDCQIHKDTKIIAGGAFYNSKIKSLTIPEGVEILCESAFENCTSLKNLQLPNSLKIIHSSRLVFGCENLTCCEYQNAKYLGNIHNQFLLLVSAENENIENCTIYENTRFIANGEFSTCRNLTSITIPDTVEQIGESAFSNCGKLERVTLPKNITEIGAYSFKCCYNLRQITIPESVVRIGEEAFYECKALTEITIPEKVTVIGGYAFKCENLKSVTFENTKGWICGEEKISVSDFAKVKMMLNTSLTWFREV